MTYEYEQLVRTIQHRAGVSWEEAERAAEATLAALSERLSAGQARDIAAELPEEARRWLRPDDGAEPFDVEEFLRRVAAREEADVETAERHARAVFVALARNLSRQELRDMEAELPKDFARLLPERKPGPSPTRMPAEEFIERVGDRAGIEREAAWRATDAVLETLADKLAGGEVDDIAAELAPALRESLERGRTRNAKRMSLGDFVRRVAEREGVSTDEAREHVGAVLRTLRDAISDDEWADLTAELPDEYIPVLAAS
jgi:uncharacterized protein (DUF2267 family)